MEERLKRPYYASIALNVLGIPPNWGNHQRQRLVTHEMGHVTGLAHPSWWPWEGPICNLNTVMVQGGFTCQPVIYQLAAVDRDGLNALYPPLP